MRRRCGKGLAWQSVFTEQDQTRSLRFRRYVEVWEFDVGFNTDFGRFNNYEHYEFSCRPLEVAKTTTGGNRRTGMNTIQALLHGLHHSVCEQDDFMDAWMAIARANALHDELKSDGLTHNIDNGHIAVSAEHDNTPPTPGDQPDQREVPERIPVISTGLHEENEAEETVILEADILQHIQGGVRMVHHLEAAREATTQEYPLIVITFGLSGEGQGRRDFYSDVLLHDVWQGIRRTWSEYQDIDLYFVEPQPVLTRWPYIVFIVEDRQMRSTGLVPVLLNFRVPADMYNLLWDFDTRAAYFNEGYTILDNLEENDLEDVCAPRGFRVCQVTFGFDSVPLLDRPRYPRGILCDVDIEEFPGEWHRTLAEFPNFEQMATTIRMLRRESGLAGGALQCCLHVLDDHDRCPVQPFEIHWTMTQHPGTFMRHLRDLGIDCELVAFVWPQPPSAESFHRWQFVGGRRPDSPSSLNFVMVRQSSGDRTLERPFINNPTDSVTEFLNALQLPEWCEGHGGLDRYRNHGVLCRRLAHGRRIDLIVDVEEEEAICLTQLKAAPLILRNDDGTPAIEEVIEHYQTHTPQEEAESETEGDQMEGDYDEDAQAGDPPEEPEQPDDEMLQRSSDSDEWTHGMIFRKGHPVAYVWAHVESYDEMVTDIASQLNLQPRDILGIHYIQPEPFDRPHIGFSAIARCQGDQYPDTTECLVLVDVFIYTRASVPQEPALYRNVIDLPPLLTRRQLLERVGLEAMCTARRNRCLVKVEGTTIPLQHTGPIFVQQASYVVIRVPPFEDEDFHCDAMSLVQTRASLKRKQPEWTYLHLFRYRRHYKRLQVSARGETSQWLIDELSDLDEEIVQGLRALHEVHDPPRDLELTRESVFLGEGWGDRGAACQEDDQLTLLDIEIKQSARHWDSHTIRSAFWCRTRITRTALLTTLRVHQHCLGDESQECFVYLNHVEIQDEAIRHVRDGDYVRLVLLGKDRPWNTLQALTAFEEQDRQRRVFGSTSEESRDQHPSASTAEHIDCRHSGMPGSEPDGGDQHKYTRGPLDYIPDTETTMVKNAHRSVLQDITNTLRGTRVPGSDAAQELWDPERPHVSDLWCANPGHAVFEPRPESRVPLILDDLLRQAIRLFPLPGTPDVPFAIELWKVDDIDELQQELCGWCPGLLTWPLIDEELYLGYLCGKAPTSNLTVYWHVKDMLLHFRHGSHYDTDLDHMRFLDKLGYGRAAIISTTTLLPTLHLIAFQNGNPHVDNRVPDHQEPDDIPEVRPRQGLKRRLTTNLQLVANTTSRCHLTAGPKIKDFRDFFGTGDGVLQLDTAELDLHPQTHAALLGMPSGDIHNNYDRLVIYIDGSSMGSLKHKDPRHLEETGTPDAWSFVVIGEYADGRPNDKEFLGWTANRVIYDPQVDHHAGATHIGSDTAEREGLLWSGIWRLSCDVDTPTLFVADAQVACNFAQGDSGTAQLTTGHYLARGIHQALAQALGADNYGIHHIRSHRGDPWNEFADVAAKQACKCYRFRPRQRIVMHDWTTIIPHLWMFFNGVDCGLPACTPNGLVADAPKLPPRQAKEIAPPKLQKRSKRTVRLSAATANVRTMYVGKEGFGGKIQYLQSQFQLDNFNIVALQETRTEAGMKGRGTDFLRVCSGSAEGHLGVETWISMNQAFGEHRGRAFLAKPSQVVILHGDPRRLLIALHFGPFTLGIYNIHAPHSGKPEAERTEWWRETTQIYQNTAHGLVDEMIVLGDFNARSGPCDHHHVFEHDDISSENTHLMLEFLAELSLCLPSTSSVHDGEHSTWTTPDGQHSQRIDFIAVPSERLHACTFSQVMRQIDLGHDGDHLAVGLDMVWDRDCRSHRIPSTCRRQTFNRDNIKGHDGFRAELCSTTVAPWEQHIEAQIHDLNTAITGALERHCPKPHVAAKKPFLDKEIMALRQQKNALRQRHSESWKHHNRSLLYRAFASWRTGLDSHPIPDAFDVQHYVGILRLGAASYSTTRRIKHQVRQAKRSYVEQVVNGIPESASSSQILAQLRPIIGTSNSRKRKGSAMPYVLTLDGQPCRTPEALVDRWVEHFGSMEGADRLNQQAQRDLWWTGLQQLQATDLSELTLQDLPKLTDLEAAMRRVTPGKAVGDDEVPPEVCRYHAKALAKLVFPGLLKLFLHGQEDLSHKGGRLISAYKRGPRNLCMSYRSLLISSHVGKCMHRALRCGQNTLYTSYMQRQQIGGRPKIAVNVGLHMARAHHRSAKLQSKPSALLFLDLKEAYYRVLRPLALGAELTDLDVANMVSRLNLPPEVLQDLQQHLREADALQLAAVPLSHRRYLQALHRDTHFRVDGQTDNCRTTIGSRPGDTFADVVFGYLWSRVLKIIEHELDQVDLLERVPTFDGVGPRAQRTGATAPLLGPTWCDDLCICISAMTSDELERRSGVICGILLDTCIGFGMLPNLDKGKTEIMLCFRGSGSRRLRVKYYSPEQDGKMLVCGEYGQHRINVVGEYKHLGGILHHGGKLSKETRKRLAVAHQAFNVHRALLFQNPRFSQTKRVELFRSLVLSGLLYGTESWVQGSRSEDLHLHGAILRLYKRLLKCAHDSHVTDRAVCTRLGLPTPTVLLRMSRLRYLGQLYNSIPQDIWNVLLQDQEWITVLEGDLQWMWSQLKHSSDLPDPADGWQRWEYILTRHPGYWKRLVRRAADHHVLQETNRELVHDSHSSILSYLRTQGTFAQDPQQPETYEPTAFGCLTCQAWFRSKAGEGAHMFRAHGHTAKTRSLFEGTACTVCMREYHTPFKLQAHLRYKRSCREALIADGAHYTPQPGKGSILHMDHERAHNDLLPVQPTCGPQLPLQDGRDWEHLDAQLHLRVVDAVLDWQGLDDPTPTTLEELLRDIPAVHTTSWTTWRTTLSEITTEFRELMKQDYHDFEETVFATLSRLQQTDAWPGFPVRLPQLVETQDYQDLCEQLLNSGRKPCWTRTVSIQREITRHRVVIHAYSGRRQAGDFQFFLDAMTQQLDGIVVHVLSLDVIISKQHGDLMDKTVRQFWIRAACSGWVVGLLAGPPCETWSRARYHALEKERRGPRPVRSSSELWGLGSLQLKELRQIIFGNTLLTFAVELMVIMAVKGGFGAMEHPAEPPEPHMPSIFRIPIVKTLLQLPGATRVRLYQGLFGSESAKPTDLVTINLHGLDKVLQQHQTRLAVPAAQSIGKDERGCFRTSKLKEYPPAMCRALACSFCEALLECRVCAEDVSEEFITICKELEISSYGDTFGPDFAG